MKKNFLTLFMILMFAIPAFATDPDIDTATASCDDGVFNSNTGPVNIEVNWEPNEINLRWYNNNTLITPSNNASNNCTYDENGLTIPVAPTRTGYTFKGWRARPQYDFSTIALDNNGTYWARGLYGVRQNCFETETGFSERFFDVCQIGGFSDLQTYEWKVQYSHGTVYGMAKCSDTGGERWQTATSLIEVTPGSNQYCWCKATGYKPSGQSTIYGPSVHLPYVHIGYRADCSRHCAWLCTYDMTIHDGYETFEQKLYGITQ